MRAVRPIESIGGGCGPAGDAAVLAARPLAGGLESPPGTGDRMAAPSCRALSGSFRIDVARQLPLDLGTPPPATFDTFVVGANRELVARLQQLAAACADHVGGGAPAAVPADRAYYLWGEGGSGRTHLLHALCHAAAPGAARLLRPRSPLSSFVFDPKVRIYAIDDCDRLPAARQIAAFNLFNEVQASPDAVFIASGKAAPMQLDLRDDLRTRLAWGLVYRVEPLTDEQKAAALTMAARERGLSLAADVPFYLLNHFQRDMPSLMAQLDALDRFSLERQRAITLPLLRTMLLSDEGADAGPQAPSTLK